MSSALAAEVREHFDFDAPELIGQCVELCKRYNMAADDMEAHWDIYSKKLGIKVPSLRPRLRRRFLTLN